MTENQLATAIIGSALEIHKHLGPGLFENVYENILFLELKNLGFHVERQVPIPLIWKTFELPLAFRADLIVEQKIIIEIKSQEKLALVHKKQLLTYLRLSNLKLGLLINFGQTLLKNGIHRIINGTLTEPRPIDHPEIFAP